MGRRTLLKNGASALGAITLLCVLAVAPASALSSATASDSKRSVPSAKSPRSSKMKASTTKHSSAHTVSRKGRRKRVRGQQKIDAERTHQIQRALIQQHYMSGEPSGKWDASTEAALRKFQADNGWQNKTVPDSRALIKLGLGPSHDHLLNPESAMTTTPDTPTPTAPPTTPATNGPSAPANQPQP